MNQSDRGARGRQEGIAARDRALAIAMKRKEEYLGARVPRQLKEKVIKRAENLGIPVSILIRHVLEDVFRDDGSVTLERSAPGGDMKAGAPSQDGALQYPGVLGWEEIKLNRAMNCATCGLKLQAGSRVTLGFGAPGEGHIILCDLCMESV